MTCKNHKQRKAMFAKMKQKRKEVSCQPVFYDRKKRKWVRVE